jgi:hypothetical protein
MDKGFKARQKALELMKTIDSLEDLNKHQDEIMGLMEESLRFSIDSMKEILEMDLEDEGIEEKVNSFMNGLDVLVDELDSEACRIDGIPGVAEAMGSFNEEMEKRLDPFAQELEKLSEQLMDKIQGKLFGGLEGMFEGEGKEGDQ